MTKDTLTIGSTDLTEHYESITVDIVVPGYTWQSVNDMTVRPEHRDLTSKVFVFDCVATTTPPSFVQSVGHLKRCSCYADDILSNITDKALRTYPKRMSRAKRKEARARERRRVERDNQWWSKR